MTEIKPQTNREIAELIAKFRMPPAFSWADLANDIETALNSRSAALLNPSEEVVRAYWDGYMAERMPDPMASELDAIRAGLRAAAMKITGHD